MSDRKPCCLWSNMGCSTPDGTLPAKLITLFCKTCAHSETFIYPSADPMNLCFAFAEFSARKLRDIEWFDNEGISIAETEVGGYEIKESTHRPGRWKWKLRRFGTVITGECGSRDGAKLKAEADYSNRVDRLYA